MWERNEKKMGNFWEIISVQIIGYQSKHGKLFFLPPKGPLTTHLDKP
jgi:hypothetical protein